MATLNVPIRIKRGDGLPTQLRQGELAFDQENVKLYIGSGTEVGGYAPNVVELTTPPTVLEDLSNISVGSGASDGDVLVYDSSNDEWVAQALAAASVAWDDVTSKPTFATVATTGDYDDLSGKPASLTPTAHKASHATGGTDALSPSDIGAAAATHSHAWGDITSGVPSEFTPASHTHGNISDDGKIGSTAGLVVQTGASGALSTLSAGTSGQVLKQGASGLEWGTAGGVGTVTSVTAGTGLTGGEITSSGTIAVTYGTTAGTACEGNDGRLDDTRTPTDNTVSTAKLQDAAVTYAKIQDVSGTDKILGRATAGAGDVEEITCTAAGRALLDDADAAAQRTTLGLGTAATSATSDFAAASHSHGNITNAGAIGSTSGLPVKTGTSGVLEVGAFGTGAGQFAEGNHTHAAADITSLANVAKSGSYSDLENVPSTFAPTAHNHAVTLEISGFIESPEAKTYVLSPAIPAAITITQLKAQTSAGTVDLAVHDDGTLVTGCSLADAGTTLASLASAISESVAAGSKLALVVSDLQSSPADLAFSIHYTVTSANNS